jgi:hypothetical protein
VRFMGWVVCIVFHLVINARARMLQPQGISASQPLIKGIGQHLDLTHELNAKFNMGGSDKSVQQSVDSPGRPS